MKERNIIDFIFSWQEKLSLSQQLQYVYGRNRISEHPFNLIFTRSALSFASLPHFLILSTKKVFPAFVRTNSSTRTTRKHLFSPLSLSWNSEDFFSSSHVLNRKSWKYVSLHTQHFTEVLPDQKGISISFIYSLLHTHPFLFLYISFFLHPTSSHFTDKMVYLSADGSEEITEFREDTCYVIGALVDRNRHKGERERLRERAEVKEGGREEGVVM